MDNENLSIVRGDDVFYTLSFTDSSGDAIDLTDWVIFFTAKKSKSQTSADLSVDVDTHTDAAAGTTQIHLPHADTALLDVGNYYYDIQVKKDTGYITTIVGGKLKVEEDITIRTTVL